MKYTKVYIVTDEYYDYEGSSSTIVGVFESMADAEEAKVAYTQKVFDKLTAHDNRCARCQCDKDCHKGGLHASDKNWDVLLKEYRKQGRLCNNGVFHPRPPVTQLNERQSIEITDYELGVIADA